MKWHFSNFLNFWSSHDLCWMGKGFICSRNEGNAAAGPVPKGLLCCRVFLEGVWVYLPLCKNWNISVAGENLKRWLQRRKSWQQAEDGSYGKGLVSFIGLKFSPVWVPACKARERACNCTCLGLSCIQLFYLRWNHWHFVLYNKVITHLSNNIII